MAGKLYCFVQGCVHKCFFKKQENDRRKEEVWGEASGVLVMLYFLLWMDICFILIY